MRLQAWMGFRWTHQQTASITSLTPKGAGGKDFSALKKQRGFNKNAAGDWHLRH